MRPYIVICGGWSVSQYDVADLRKRGYVIGVNESALLFHCDVGITMDRLWAENRSRTYYVNRPGELWVREGAAKNLPYHPRLWKFACDHETCEMSTTPKILNGMNSGMVALNFAYQMAPHTVYIFGLDHQKGPNGEPYHHPPYNWPEAKPEGNTTSGKYKAWGKHYARVLEQFTARRSRLVQVNNRSTVKDIPSISFAQFLTETKQ
jgi:hypothetical protein